MAVMTILSLQRGRTHTIPTEKWLYFPILGSMNISIQSMVTSHRFEREREMCSFLDVSSREHFIDPACSVKCRCNSSRKELVNQSWSNQIYFQPNFLYSKGTCFFTSLFYSDSLWDPQPCILASVRAHTSHQTNQNHGSCTHVTLKKNQSKSLFLLFDARANWSLVVCCIRLLTYPWLYPCRTEWENGAHP